MKLRLAIVLGLVQGATEFLPVSSTAHLRLAPTLLGQPDPGAAFTAVIQLGTLAAVIIYFARDLGRMTVGLLRGPKDPDGRLALLVILGTVPIGIAGLLLKPLIEGPLRSLWVIACALAALAIVMVVIEKVARRERSVTMLGWQDALIIGVAQATALIPGVSRSGATLCAAAMVGLMRPDAARFSFLLSIPAVAAAGIFQLKSALGQLHGDKTPLIVATVVAGLSGYIAIAWLMRWLSTRTLVPFAAYRLLLAGALVIMLVTGLVPAR
jgi:undecaprenyl-diphosphatase